jgi:hypothetical protein
MRNPHKHRSASKAFSALEATAQEEKAMDVLSSDVKIDDERGTPGHVDDRKPWVEPEITWYQQLQAITLGIYCTNTLPPCTSPQPPF